MIYLLREKFYNGQKWPDEVSTEAYVDNMADIGSLAVRLAGGEPKHCTATINDNQSMVSISHNTGGTIGIFHVIKVKKHE